MEKLKLDTKVLELSLLRHIVEVPLEFDLHTETAARIFNILPSQVTEIQRLAAENWRFLKMYGASDGIIRSLGIYTDSPNPDWYKDFIKMNVTKKYSMMFGVAHVMSKCSEDPSTQTGSVIANGDVIISTGYNGLPRGMQKFDGIEERPTKYYYYEHGERNAIFNAARIGACLTGCTIYVLGVPCAPCMRAIIQSGIVEIVISNYKDTPERWIDSCLAGLLMVRAAGIPVYVQHTLDVDRTRDIDTYLRGRV